MSVYDDNGIRHTWFQRVGATSRMASNIYADEITELQREPS